MCPTLRLDPALEIRQHFREPEMGRGLEFLVLQFKTSGTYHEDLEVGQLQFGIREAAGSLVSRGRT
jgi:hypothetical protein